MHPQFAEDHRAGRPQFAHAVAVLHREGQGLHHRARPGRQVGRRVIVLDGDRDAVQRPPRPRPGDLGIRHPRRVEGRRGKVHEASKVAVETLDPIEIGGDEFGARQLPRRDQPRELRDRLLPKGVSHGAPGGTGRTSSDDTGAIMG